MSVSTITPDQTAAAVLQLYDAFARRDVPAVLACMTDDVQWHESAGLPWGGLHVGPGAVAQGVFAPALEQIPDFSVTPEEIAGSDDTVAVVHRYRGTVAATGSELNILGVGVWTVRDGRIARYRQFTDTVRFRVAMGA